MATPFLPYDGSKAKFVLQFKDNGGGAVQLVPLRPVAGVALPTFTRATTATTVLADGLIGSVASGIPRSYYDPTTLEYQKYLAEGVAPNESLKGAFKRFRDWMIDIYKKLVNIDSPLNNQIRGVMARGIVGPNTTACASQFEAIEGLDLAGELAKPAEGTA